MKKTIILTALFMLSCMVTAPKSEAEAKIEKVVDIIEFYNKIEQVTLYRFFIGLEGDDDNARPFIGFAYHNLKSGSNETIDFSYEELKEISSLTNVVYSAMGITLLRFYLYTIKKGYGFGDDEPIIIPRQEDGTNEGLDEDMGGDNSGTNILPVPPAADGAQIIRNTVQQVAGVGLV